jgi:hypothetical protein
VNVEPPRTYRFNNAPIPCTIGLQRVAGGYAFPQTEILSGAFTRTNFDAVTGNAIWIGINAGPGVTRTTTTGTVDAFGQGAPQALTAKRYFVTPAQHYIGACEVQYQYSSGGPWYVMNGRQVPNPFAWRITNGFIRFTPGTNGVLEVWNGSAWEACANLRWGTSGLTAGTNFNAANPTIVRNSAERVTVRAVDMSVKSDVTFSLARAAASVELYSGNFGVAAASATASTLVGTHVLHQTSNDANGNRFMLGAIGTSGGAHSTSTANGAVYCTGAASLMVGVNFNGSGAVGPDTPTDVRNQWIGIPALTQRLVTR